MNTVQQHDRTLGWHTLAAVAGPFVVVSAYLILSHLFDPDFKCYLGAFLFAVAFGTGSILLSPASWRWRLICAAIYVPIIAALLYAYGYIFYEMFIGGVPV